MRKILTNGEMVAIVNGIIKFQEREQIYFEKTGKKLLGSRIKIAYTIRKNKGNIIQALKPYHEEMDTLVKSCISQEASKKNIIKIKPECEEEWEQATGELKNIEAEVDISTFRLEDLKGLELDVTDLEALEIMIED